MERHSFRRVSAETLWKLPFQKILTPRNWVKLRYFTQWSFARLLICRQLISYFSSHSPGSPEQKPLLTRQDKIEGSSTIQEDDFDDGLTTLPTFNSQVTLTKTSSLPRSRNNSLPRNYQKRHMRQFDEYSNDGKVLKRSNSKTSSIVSVETVNYLNRN